MSEIAARNEDGTIANHEDWRIDHPWILCDACGEQVHREDAQDYGLAGYLCEHCSLMGVNP